MCGDSSTADRAEKLVLFGQKIDKVRNILLLFLLLFLSVKCSDSILNMVSK